jgi:predicted hydrolase (HD superfamily)
VSREDVLNGAADLGVELEGHVQFVVEAMQRNAAALGLAGGVPAA